jgi:excisionase family DNA binding protein
MTQQLAIIDLAALERLEKRLDTVLRLLEGVKATPRPEWVTVNEAARALKVSPDTIRRQIRDGKMEARGAGKARRVRLVE